MVSPTTKNIVIVVQDDYIRHSLRTFFSKYQNLNVFTSNNGVEGVGYAVITNPDLIILDSNLPKYSGVELINFLKSKDEYHKKRSAVIVIYEGGSIPKVPEHYFLIQRMNKNFLVNLIKLIKEELNIKKINERSLVNKLRLKLSEKLISSSNKINTLVRETQDMPYLDKWTTNIGILILKLRETFIFSIFFIISGKGKEINIDQSKTDSYLYRAKVYPTLSIFFASILMVISQVLLLFLGGVVIFNTKVVSVFAATPKEIEYNLNFNQTIYSSDEIEFSNKSLHLRKFDKDISTIATDWKGDPNKAPLNLNNQDIPAIASYSDSTPVVYFTKDLNCQNPIQIKEQIQTPVIGQIGYQLSPDFNNWYFYNEATKSWELDNNGFPNINTSDKINASIDKYDKSKLSNTLYLRAFFISNGFEDVRLNSLSVVCK
jgi:CheY-like chemotaxis protein